MTRDSWVVYLGKKIKIIITRPDPETALSLSIYRSYCKYIMYVSKEKRCVTTSSIIQNRRSDNIIRSKMY